MRFSPVRKMEVCRDSLWNSSVSWDTSSPRLSSCLTSLLEIAAGSLLPVLLLPWLLLLASSSPHGLQQASRGGRCGLVLLLLRCLTALLLLASTLYILLAQTTDQVVLELAATSLICASALLSCAMELLLHRARAHTSPLLALYWLLLLLLLLPQLPAALEDLASSSSPLLPTLVRLLRWATALLGLFLQLPSNLSVLPPGLSPEAESSCLYHLTFSWLSPLVWRGWKQPLLQTDLQGINIEVRQIPHMAS